MNLIQDYMNNFILLKNDYFPIITKVTNYKQNNIFFHKRDNRISSFINRKEFLYQIFKRM